MKARFAIIALAIAALASTSCIKDYEYVYNNTMRIANITVPQDSWSYSISASQEAHLPTKFQGNWFYAELNVPEITSSAYKGGLIKVYRVYDNTQAELPEVHHFENYDPVADASTFFTETVDYDFSVGKVTIYYTRSDFEYEVDATLIPNQMKFRIVVVD